MEILYPGSMALSFGIAGLLLYSWTVFPLVWISLGEMLGDKAAMLKSGNLLQYGGGAVLSIGMGSIVGYAMASFYNWLLVF